MDREAFLAAGGGFGWRLPDAAALTGGCQVRTALICGKEENDMYEMRGRIRYSEVDREGRLTIPALINYLQDCCTFQSEDLGVGLDFLKEHQMGWFVTSWWIHVEELPRMGDEVVVVTWPYDFKGFLGYRNFAVKTPEGKTCIEVNSLWILMNVETGRPVRQPREMKDAYILEAGLQREWGDRKREISSQLEEVYRFTVQGMHIDTNGHMNNEKYVAAAQECMPPELQPTDIYVEYKKSAMAGDEVICRRAPIEGGMQVVLADSEDNVFSVIEYKRDQA